jgi:uncharacterized protein (DUF1501 family)
MTNSTIINDLASKPQDEAQQPHSPARRQFLNRAGHLALAGTALPTAINLAMMGEAAAFNAPAGSYKALVCVFLYGANDHANTLVSYDDATYNKYQTIRTTIAIPKADMANTVLNPTSPLADGRQYALHPTMTGLAGLFNNGACGVLLNVGPLIQPVTKTQYQARSVPLPPKLFSHNDQQSIWQSSESEGSTIGWGGNFGDLGLTANPPTASTFTCVSATGNAVFLAGDAAIPYQVSSGGAIRINGIGGGSLYNNAAARAALNTLVRQTGSNVLEQEYNRVTRRSIDSEGAVTAALTAVPTTTAALAPLAAITSSNALASQLMVVARMIAARAQLGNPTRQVFMVSIGGFDLHDFLIARHPGLLTQVSDAMTAFYNATVNLGIANQVTQFTASDFGRTLTSNGDGSDHGWGSHHFIVGGSVIGKTYYGYNPPMSIGSTTAAEDQWHVGQGRLLPTTSVDQYAATLGNWFGVTDSEMPGVLPNINNFNNVTLPGTNITFRKNLGFMR